MITSAWAAASISSTVALSTGRLQATMPPKAERGSQA